MKKHVFLFLMIPAFACAENISSEDESISSVSEATQESRAEPPAQINQQKESRNCDSHIHIGGSYTYAWITPDGNPPFQGSLGGVQGIYEYRPHNSLYAGVKFSWRQGDTKQSSNTRALLDFDAHERLGYTFAGSGNRWLATLFTGLGYRYLGHELKQPGLVDLDFNYNELFIPVGFLVSRTVNSYFSLGVNFTWMPQVYPAVTIIPIDGANWIINRTLENFLVEVPLIFSTPRYERLTVELKPFVEYWKDGKTSAVSNFGFALNIPGNKYLFCGAELNLGWSF